MTLNLKIDIVDRISYDDFYENYFLTQKPLVIRKLSYDIPATQLWSLEYFKNNMGEMMVPVFDNSNTKAAGSAYTRADRWMKLRDFIDHITKKENSTLRMFLFNFFKARPELKNDFPCPSIFKGMLGNIGYMFFGGRNTVVRMHQDIDMSNVLHTHYGGKKRVVLFSPAYSTALYKLPLNTYSLVNIDKPDYDNYPALKEVYGYQVILEHGDTLFMPSGYWHYMTYLEPSYSVAYRKMAHSFDLKLNGVLNLCVYMPFDKLMNLIMGDSWLKYKTVIAHKRAARMLRYKEKKHWNRVYYAYSTKDQY